MADKTDNTDTASAVRGAAAAKTSPITPQLRQFVFPISGVAELTPRAGGTDSESGRTRREAGDDVTDDEVIAFCMAAPVPVSQPAAGRGTGSMPPQLNVAELSNNNTTGSSSTRQHHRVRFSLAPDRLDEEPGDALGAEHRPEPTAAAAPASPVWGEEAVLPQEPEPYSMITRTEGVHISHGTQVLALLQRTGRQYLRRKLLILAEIVSPLLFVVLLIILNLAFGSDSVAETIFVNPGTYYGAGYAYQLNSEDFTTYLCYGNDASPIDGLFSCDVTGFQSACDGDESGIPVEELCYVNGFTSPSAVVAQYVNSMMGTVIALPTLDSIIVHQWMAKKAGLASDSRTRTALAALSNVGIGVSATTRFDSISYSGALYFAPAASVPSSLIDYFHTRSKMFKYVYGGIFETVAEAKTAMARNNASEVSLNSTWGLIIVNDISVGFDVEVQLHSSALPAFSPPVSLQFRGGFTYDGTDMFLASGFISLQRLLYDYYYESMASAGALANLNSGAVTAYNHSTVYPVIASFPTITANTPYLLSLASSLVAFVMVLSMLYPFAQMTKRIVLEKELRIQESMCIMGLKRSCLWANFLLVTFFEYVLISILLTVLLCAVVTKRANPFAVFLVLFLYMMTLIPLCGLVSTFFSRARMAALMSPLIYFVLSMPIFAMGSADGATVIGLSLLSPTALAALLTDIFTAEAGGGFHMSDFHSVYFSVKPYVGMLILAADCVLYLMLMFYLDAVLPQEWGTSKHPLFFLIEPWGWLRDTCCGGGGGGGRCVDRGSGASQPGDAPSTELSKAAEATPLSEDAQLLQLNSETTGTGIASAACGPRSGGGGGFGPRAGRDSLTGAAKTVSVRLEHLCKFFDRNGKRFAAVDDVSWDMYRGEIAVLLGPNGAGKSTTINMITGMLAADRGDCFIEGFSMRRNLAAARHQIGYCPQHNILWPDLTCREHLEFYGKIKGLRGAELEDAVVDILRAVDLEEKIDVIPTRMSGGQKRKLSVAIAFVGRNRVVLLDEPTAGMDAAARRHTWSLLRAMTQHHTIMLTTHYMDEADLLGDNIAIVTEGVLQCAGSTAFLREYAGAGYTLRFDLSPFPAVDGDDGTVRQAKVEAVWAQLHGLVISHLPDAVLTLQTDAEVEYELRRSTEARLPEFLKDAEERGNRDLNIRGYALRAPTLEDVFLRVVEHHIASGPESAGVAAGGGGAHDHTTGPLSPASHSPSHGNGGVGSAPRTEAAAVLEGMTPLGAAPPAGGEGSARASSGAPDCSAFRHRRSTVLSGGGSVPGSATAGRGPTTPSVYHSMNRRMSRASLRFFNNESVLNYAGNAEREEGEDAEPLQVLAAGDTAARRLGHMSSTVADFFSTGDGGGDDAGSVSGAYLAAAESANENCSVLGVPRRRPMSVGDSSRRVVGFGDGEVADKVPLRKGSGAQAGRDASVLSGGQGGDGDGDHGQGDGGDGAAPFLSEVVGMEDPRVHGTGQRVAGRQAWPLRVKIPVPSSAAAAAARGRAPKSVPGQPGNASPHPQRGEDALSDVFSAVPTIVAGPLLVGSDSGSRGAEVTPAAAAAPGPAATNVVRNEMFYYKHVTDRHLDQVWATRHTAQQGKLWALQLRGMMYKRFFCALRDRRMQFFQIACPVFCILLAMLLQLVKSSGNGTLMMSPDVFETPSAMQVSACVDYMSSVAGMSAYGHHFDEVTFTDPNFVSSTDMSEQLLDTWFTQNTSRFMSLQCADPNIQQYMGYVYASAIGSRTVTVLLYNTSSRDSLPIAVHMTYALAFFGALGTPAEAAARLYSMKLSPLPQTSKSSASTNAIAGILIGVIVLIPFTFLPANPVAWVVKEYESRARHLQSASGLSYLIYWIGNFLFDYTAYVASMALVLVIFVIFQRSEYIGYANIGATIVSFAIYGACYCCCSYMVSFLFSEHTTAQIAVLGASFLTGFLCVMLVFVLSLLDKTLTASNTLRWIFRLLPPYSIGEVILNLALLEQKKLTDPSLTAWSMSITVWPDIYMAIEAPIFAAATLLWDHPNRRAIASELVEWCAAWCCCGASRRRRRARKAQKAKEKEEEVKQRLRDSAVNAVAAATTAAAAAPPHTQTPSPSARLAGTAAATPISWGARAAATTADVATTTTPSASHVDVMTSTMRRRHSSTSQVMNQQVDVRDASMVRPNAEEREAELSGFEQGELRHDLCTQSVSIFVNSTGTPLTSRRRQQHLRVVIDDTPERPAVTPVSGGRADTTYRLPSVLGPSGAEAAGAAGGAGSFILVDLAAVQQQQLGQTSPTLGAANSAMAPRNDATLPAPREMLYPPPRWSKADALRLREEDSDVEEERGAVYAAEERHVQRQLDRHQPSRSTEALHDPTNEGLPEEAEAEAQCDVIRVVDLRKVYDAPHKVAVSALSFSVMHGEVFGFLGTNGAGKSSALSIITQEQFPTSGRAYVCGHDVVRQSSQAAGCLGYCPQFDACIDLLTVAEHLRLYAMVRGVAVAQLDSLVESLMVICNLTQYRHVFSNELSGGNRRKLSVAIALIGAPKVVCLDEPTSGMDPLARQLLWRALDRVSRKCSIILTTHHLEEVEALADCVGIMVDGSLSCFGDLPHLKHKYARNAYELTVRVSASARKRAAARREQEQRQRHAPGTADSTPHPGRSTRRMSVSYAGNEVVDTSDALFQFMLQTFPSALLIDSFNNERYVYTLPATRDVAEAMQQLLESQQSQRSITFLQTPLGRPASAAEAAAAAAANASPRVGSSGTAKRSPPIVRLSTVFETLRGAQEELGITEYSVSQVSLEQVFLRVCSAEETLKRDRRRTRAMVGGGGGTARSTRRGSADSSVSMPVLPATSPRMPLQRQGSVGLTSLMPRGPEWLSVTSPARRRLSTASFGAGGSHSVGAHSGTTPRVTFAEYRRQRALWRMRADAAEPQRTPSEQQRLTEPDNEHLP